MTFKGPITSSDMAENNNNRCDEMCYEDGRNGVGCVDALPFCIKRVFIFTLGNRYVYETKGESFKPQIRSNTSARVQFADSTTFLLLVFIDFAFSFQN